MFNKKTEQEFELFFEEVLLPRLKMFKSVTDELNEYQTKIIIGIGIVIMVFGLFAELSGTNDMFYFVFGLLLFSPLFYSVLYRAQMDALRNKIRSHYKTKIFLPIFKFYFSNVYYHPNQSIPLRTVQKSRLVFPDPAIREGEDYIKLKLGNTLVQFCELKAYKFSTSETPAFHGVFCVAEFNKSFKSRTYVVPRSSNFTRKLFWKNMENNNNGAFIELEDESFNSEYIIFGTSQVEARYILTPTLMTKILLYKEKLGSKISLSFVENRLYVAIPQVENLFEIKLSRDATDLNNIKMNADFFLKITEIVEDLDLNNDIWIKNKH